MRERASEQQSLKGRRKGELATISNFHFLLRPYIIHTVKYYWLNQRWLMTFLDDLPQCLRSFRNRMLTEIGNIMIAPYRSLLMWLVNDFWGLCWSTVWSQPCRTYKPANQTAEKGLPGKPYDTKSHHICCVSPQWSHWQTADTFLVSLFVSQFHSLWFPAFSGVDIKMYERSFFSRPLHSHLLSPPLALASPFPASCTRISFPCPLHSHSHLLSCAALTWLLAAPPNGELACRLGTG